MTIITDHGMGYPRSILAILASEAVGSEGLIIQLRSLPQGCLEVGRVRVNLDAAGGNGFYKVPT